MPKQKEHEEPYFPAYRGFSFGSKEAQYRYLRSKWPHHQHRILAYMFFKNIMGYDPYVTIDEIADELKIHRPRSCLDLKKMVSRGHMKSWRDVTPHRYYLTDQGRVYSEYIWINFYKYNLDLFDFFHDICFMPDIKFEDGLSMNDFYEKNYKIILQMIQKQYAFEGMRYCIQKDMDKVKYYQSKSMIFEEYTEKMKVYDRILKLSK